MRISKGRYRIYTVLIPTGLVISTIYGIRGGQTAIDNLEKLAVIFIALSWFLSWRATMLEVRSLRGRK